MTDSDGTASLEANLRLGNGLTEHDRQRVLRRLSGLDARLRSFRADAVDLLVTVKERETRSQRTTLEAIDRQPATPRCVVSAHWTRRSPLRGERRARPAADGRQDTTGASSPAPSRCRLNSLTSGCTESLRGQCRPRHRRQLRHRTRDDQGDGRGRRRGRRSDWRRGRGLRRRVGLWVKLNSSIVTVCSKRA